MSSNAGLDGVIAADTVLSLVDGEAGRLIIRGYELQQLAGHYRFEQALRILLEGFMSEELLADLDQRIGAAREEIFPLVADLGAGAAGVSPALSPIEALRALMARLKDGNDDATALRLLAAPAVLVPAIDRAGRGLPPVPPSARRTHAQDMLYMMRGEAAPDFEAHALDSYLVTVLDHGLNASTFAARVVASTHAGLGSAVLAALSALKGPLHGGAPGPVLDMLDAIARPELAAAWIAQALARGDRLMGFGHRIYRVRDPRADALRIALQSLADAGHSTGERLALAEAVERTALAALRETKPQRLLETNVEFYTAVLLEALQIDRDSFTGVFAAGRVGGWIAHAREQVRAGRLIRPQSRYIGSMPRHAA